MKKFLSFFCWLTLLTACSVPSAQSAPISSPTPQASEIPTQTLAPIPTPTAEQPAEVQVTYVGVSGFLITAGDKKILIDGFNESLSSKAKTALDQQDPPFDDIDLILVTHNHSDHFSASQVSDYMSSHPDIIFVSTTQAVDELSKLSSDFADRSIAMDPREGNSVHTNVGDIQIEAIYMSHGEPPSGEIEIYNNSYLITVNGLTFFHTGDIVNLTDIFPYHLEEKDIDLAFIVYFFLLNKTSKKFFDQGIAAKYVLPIHYQAGFDAHLIRASFPDAVIFSKPLETWTMP